MTDKPNEKPIINPFKDVDPHDLLVKITNYETQGGFLNEPPYVLVNYDKSTDQFVLDLESEKISSVVKVKDFSVEIGEKVYICRKYSISYDFGGGRKVPMGNLSNRSFRVEDVLIVGPQDLVVDETILGLFPFPENMVKHPSLTIEIEDSDPNNKSVLRDKKGEIIQGILEKDVNRAPSSFFFKERDTFTIKCTASHPVKKPIAFCNRVSFLSYSDVGLK